jgi:6-pyruvoyltetrahydropterin/6-carboxytetrahydropterin synthase
MYRIAKTFHFSSSHQLSGLPVAHQCSRLHGHNYVVEVLLKATTLSEQGFVVDYGELQPFKAIIDNELDHRHLNDVVEFNPTAELLAQWLYRRAKQLWPEVCAVRVSETPNTWAEYHE